MGIQRSRNRWLAEIRILGRDIKIGRFDTREEALAAYQTELGKHGKERLLPNHKPAEVRFWAKVEKTPSCWIWKGALRPDGYGLFQTDTNVVRAHVWAFENMRFPIPKGFVPDHTCHNSDSSCSGGVGCRHRRCVRPDHMEPVLRGENVRRGYQTRACCRNGHELVGSNLVWRFRKGRSTPVHHCKACEAAAIKRRVKTGG